MAEYTLSYTASEIEELLGKIDNLENIILKKAYPIGSIFMSTNSENPSTYLGFGTWVAWGSGRVPVAVADGWITESEVEGGSSYSSYTPSGTVGNTTLTVNQIPSHSHGNTSYEIVAYPSKTSDGKNVTWATSSGNWGYVDNETLHNYVGGGQAHNHTFTGTTASISTLQPYITCYMWKRTA